MIVSELVVGSGEHDKSERTKQMEPILRAKFKIFFKNEKLIAYLTKSERTKQMEPILRAKVKIFSF